MPIHTDPDVQEVGQQLYLDMVKQITAPNLICICNQIRAFYSLGVVGQGQSHQGGVCVFKGAHVILEDDGKFYGLWIKSVAEEMLFKKGRISSHYGGGKSKTAPQYEVVFPKGWGGLLFGLVEQNDKQGWKLTYPLKTWFQTEGAPLSSSFFSHVGTTAEYVLTGNNVGPKGNSPFTDKKPLTVKKADIDSFHESDWSPSGTW